MADELGAARKFLYDLLRLDSFVSALVGSRIYAGVAPEDPTGVQAAVLPFVVFNCQAAIDRTAVGAGARIFTRATYQVRAVTREGGFATAGAIFSTVDNAIMATLQTTVSLNSVTYWVQSAIREQPFERFEIHQGVRYNSCGGLFRLFINT